MFVRIRETLTQTYAAVAYLISMPMSLFYCVMITVQLACNDRPPLVTGGGVEGGGRGGVIQTYNRGIAIPEHSLPETQTHGSS